MGRVYSHSASSDSLSPRTLRALRVAVGRPRAKSGIVMV